MIKFYVFNLRFFPFNLLRRLFEIWYGYCHMFSLLKVHSEFM